MFNPLKKAYIDARYQKSHSITKQELKYLSDRVEGQRDLAGEIFKKRIVGIRKET